MTEDNIKIFKYIDNELNEWSPINCGYEWNNTNFNNKFKDDKELVQDVYRYLVMYEDLDAIYEGKFKINLNTWLYRNYINAPDEWRNLLKLAITQKQNYKEEYDYPFYWQPSLWLLHKRWMKDNNYNFIAEEMNSLTFKKEDFPVETRLIYPAYKSSVEEIVQMLENDEILDDDIPEDKYDEVYHLMRQK